MGREGILYLIGKITYKIGYFIFFLNLSLDFPEKKVWRENYYDTWLPIPITMLHKVFRFCFFAIDPPDQSDYRVLESPIFNERVKANLTFS